MATAALFPLLVATPIYLLINETKEVRDNDDASAYYISNDTMSGLRFLKQRSETGRHCICLAADKSFHSGIFWKYGVMESLLAMSVDFDDRVVWFQTYSRRYQDSLATTRGRAISWGTGIEYIFVDDSPRQSIREEWVEMGHHSEKRRRGLSEWVRGDFYKHRAG